MLASGWAECYTKKTRKRLDESSLVDNSKTRHAEKTQRHLQGEHLSGEERSVPLENDTGISLSVISILKRLIPEECSASLLLVCLSSQCRTIILLRRTVRLPRRSAVYVSLLRHHMFRYSNSLCYSCEFPFLPSPLYLLVCSKTRFVDKPENFADYYTASAYFVYIFSAYHDQWIVLKVNKPKNGHYSRLSSGRTVLNVEYTLVFSLHGFYTIVQSFLLYNHECL